LELALEKDKHRKTMKLENEKMKLIKEKADIAIAAEK